MESTHYLRNGKEIWKKQLKLLKGTTESHRNSAGCTSVSSRLLKTQILKITASRALETLNTTTAVIWKVGNQVFYSGKTFFFWVTLIKEHSLKEEDREDCLPQICLSLRMPEGSLPSSEQPPLSHIFSFCLHVSFCMSARAQHIMRSLLLTSIDCCRLSFDCVWPGKMRGIISNASVRISDGVLWWSVVRNQPCNEEHRFSLWSWRSPHSEAKLGRLLKITWACISGSEELQPLSHVLQPAKKPRACAPPREASHRFKHS